MKPKIIISSFLFVSILAIGSSLAYAQNRYHYRFAICAKFKNDALWLKEWITYHHNVLGAEHFYLYNDESSDNYLKILQPYINTSVVELINWKSDSENHPYQHCVKNKALHEAKWVAFINTNEFIVPVHGIPSFYHYLQQMENKNKGSLKITGSLCSNSQICEPSKPSIPKEHISTSFSKNICRPIAIESYTAPYNPQLVPHYQNEDTDPNIFRIYRYSARNENAFSEKPRITKNELLQNIKTIEDQAMVQYLPTMLQILKQK